jgi:hypothetical protein
MVRVHGNYCGPNWSAGAVQPSVESDVPAIDEFDETCRIHDAQYARGGSLSAADFDFFNRNVGRGALRTAAAFAVGAQGLARTLAGQSKTMKKGNVRGSNGSSNSNNAARPNLPRNRPKNRKSKRAARSPVSMTIAPLSIGKAIEGVAVKTQTTHDGDRMMVWGQEIPIVAAGGTSGTMSLVGGHRLNPLYFLGSRLQLMSSTYERFRIHKIRCRYVTSVASTTLGDVVLAHIEDPTAPFFNPASANFLTRAISKPGCVVSSVWKDFVVDIDVNTEEKYIALNQVQDERDSSVGDIIMYTNANTTASCGLLMIQYQIELIKPLYTASVTNSSLIHDYLNITATQGGTAVDTQVYLTGLPSTIGLGQILKVYVRSAVIGTGATAANAWRERFATGTVNISIAEGDIFYLKSDGGTSGYLYPTFQAAAAGQVQSAIPAEQFAIQQRTATTTSSTFTLFILSVTLPDVNKIEPV